MKILIGSGNKDKIKEIRELLQDLDVELLTCEDFDNFPDVIEDRDSIIGNAEKKATELAEFSRMICLADDTGFFVETLGGEPGVYSSRYAGINSSYKDNRIKLLKNMQNKQNRNAYFKTVMVLASPDKILAETTGIVKGKVTKIEYGGQGFGYDSIFRVNATGKTFGEMKDSEKQKISHRARALTKMIQKIKDIIGGNND